MRLLHHPEAAGQVPEPPHGHRALRRGQEFITFFPAERHHLLAVNDVFRAAKGNKMHFIPQGKLRKILVTGCMTQRYGEDVTSELPEVDGILGTGSYKDIVGYR